ncbi:MAG: immune inhibitor A, partial [Acidobacteriota bacterium]|nr:immune inhibitor A [Acidobacteriota bacterium]
NDHEYSYVVAGFGASDSCMGAASACATVVPVAFLGVDEAEVSICAGDDAVWAITVNEPFVPPVAMSLSGEPAGTTATFDPNPLPGPLPQITVLTVGNTSAAVAGSYLMTATADDTVNVFDLFLTLNVFDDAPGAPALQLPPDGATNQPPRPDFAWDAASQAQTYTIEIATDPGFVDIVDTASGLTATTYTPAVDLATNTVHYWRVRADNSCAGGANSATFSFVTEPVPGDCTLGTDPNQVFVDDLEGGAPGWTHSGPGDTWALSDARTHSGVNAFYAVDVSTVSDQYLVSPPVALPGAEEAPLSLRFWHWQAIEDSGSGCFDGAVVEVSTNGGGSWIRLEAELLTDPYDGTVSSCCSNPIAGDEAWCADPQDWFESIVDLDAFAGQLVQLRFRLATDSSVSHEGWYVDDVEIQSCGNVIFEDGFESGDTSAWSSTVP